MPSPSPDIEIARDLLCALGDHIRDRIAAARRAADDPDALAAVSALTASDTIYAIDRVGERAIEEWFHTRWPRHWPVEIVMEGIDPHTPLTFPESVAPERARWKCIIDPIDGTRGLMYDKRAAWVLAALAPQRGPDTRLADLAAAAMTEIPTSKQRLADQFSAIRGAGPAGLRATSIDPRDGTRAQARIRPSRATDFHHGFASLSKFFPEGRALTATIEERLWAKLGCLAAGPSPLIFDDQYICTAGQFHELLVGHDRMLGDLRPLVLRKLGLAGTLVSHPYDVCTALILEEAGVTLEHPLGGPLDAPLDAVSPVAWIGFANRALADLALPVLRPILLELLS